jgi:glycine/D-amino acid oxidase-like deaminating enzyme
MLDRSEGRDIAILGAGPIGCAIAYSLARRKIPAVALDWEGPGGSRMTSGRFRVPPAAAAQYAHLCRRGIEHFPPLEAEIGSIGYVRSGGLVPALSETEMREGTARARQQADAGLDVRWLSREEAIGLEPSLSPEILGAAYSQYDGSVNADLLVRRLVNAARRIGGAFLFHCGHLTVRPRPGGFLIRGGMGEIQANQLVLAAGVDDPDIRRQLEIALPLHRVHDLMLVTEPVLPVLHHTLASAYQTGSGEVVLEGPASDGGALEPMLAIARGAARLLPSLATARVLRAWAGPRSVPADEWPIVGTVGDNTYVAIAREEITLCLLLGEAMAEIITRRHASSEIDVFSPARFSATTAAAAGGDFRQDSGGTP